MRLSPKEQKHISDAIHEKDPKAEIWLYGSRADPQKKGGDIDLLVLSEVLTYSSKIDLLIKIKDRIGEQKIDLCIRTHTSAQTDSFFKEALKTAVRLA